jgi:UDP-N-acetylmuramoyl-L-alanyl-D-glutamate--2,6-diaminopimelate ligase
VRFGIAALPGVPGRLEPVDRGQPFRVFVDYAHTPDALARLVRDAREFTEGSLILVFGCGGERDPGKRPEMGRIAARGADRILLTSDNPRSEDPIAILREIDSGVREVPGADRRCRTIPDRREAVAAAVAGAHPGDTVLVAGKGHESGQETAGRIEPMDDRQVASDALARLGFVGGERDAGP